MKTFKAFRFACPCRPDETFTALQWDSDAPPRCPFCRANERVGRVEGRASASAAVIGDECDVVIRHGICNPDGTPKRYTSKSDMRQAARALGLENRVEHVPLPGTDKSPHTSRWI